MTNLIKISPYICSQFRCRNQQVVTAAQSLSNMHQCPSQTPSQNQSQPTEHKYDPTREDLLKRQILSEDFLQQLPPTSNSGDSPNM